MRVVICSSMANDTEVQAFRNRIQSYLKHILHSSIVIPFDVPFNRTQEPDKKAKNRQFYFQAIDRADLVIVFNKNHVGIGTALEIGYALARRKTIKFTHQPVEGQEGDELRGLLADESVSILQGKWAVDE